MRFLSLFAGIGGFELGLERAGWECAGQVEIDPYCLKVLEKHWPTVPRFTDVRSVTGEEVTRLCGPVDAVVGGFPCQDISAAGKGAGIHAERSGLWWEMLRVIREVRPVWVLAENVPALRTRGADDVLGALEEHGYTCWPVVVGAWAVGAPHERDRAWIVAHAASGGRDASPTSLTGGGETGDAGRWSFPSVKAGGRRGAGGGAGWISQSGLARVVDGAPARVDRTVRLGNSIVPQVAEVIGRAILNTQSVRTITNNKHPHEEDPPVIGCPSFSE